MANQGICTVRGCDNSAAKRGWCGAHYRRWQRTGDAVGTKPIRCSPGSKLKWLQQHASYSGDDCLRWPFAYNPNGYGDLPFEGSTTSANRAMCMMAHGPAPSRAHEAAHCCGNGGGGCLNPQHLAWKTAAQNQADRIADGTSNRGIRAPANKLSEQQVRELRNLEGTLSRNVVAARYGVSGQAISLIWSRRNWSWLA